MSHRLYIGYRLSSLLRVRQKCTPKLTQLGAERSRAFASPPRTPSTGSGRKRQRSEGEAGSTQQPGAHGQQGKPALKIERAQREKVDLSFSRDSASLSKEHWQAIIKKHEAKPKRPSAASYEVIEAYVGLGKLPEAVRLVEDKFAAYAEAPASFAERTGRRGTLEYEARARLRAEANIRRNTQETRAFISLIYSCVRVREHALATRVIKCMIDHDMRPRSPNHWITALTSLTVSGRLELLGPFLNHANFLAPSPQEDGLVEGEDWASPLVLRALQALQAAVDRPSAVEEALQFVRGLRRRGWLLNRECTLLAMEICRQHVKPTQADAFLRMAVQNGVTPDGDMFATLVGACALAKDEQGARRAVQQMRSHDMPPDVLVLSTIMRGFREAKDPKGALIFLRSIKYVLNGQWTPVGTRKEPGASGAAAGKADQAVGRKALQKGESALVRRFASTCATSHRLDVAREAISDVLEEGPMRTMLQHEVTLLAGKASSVEVLAVLEAMSDAGHKPSIEAYAAACKVVKDTPGRIKLIAARPYDNISEFFPYSVWLTDLGRSDSYGEALELLGVLEREKLPVTSRGYTAVIRACGRAGNLQEAERIVELRTQRGLLPDKYMYNALLVGHAQTAQWERALATLYHMALEGVYPDIISINTTITACDRAGQWKVCVKLFLRCLREGKAAPPRPRQDSPAKQLSPSSVPASTPQQPAFPFPDSLSLHLCVCACLHANRFNEAARLLVRPLGITPMLESYDLALNAMASHAPEHMDPTPVDVLQSMRARGFTPSPHRLENVLRWCARGRWWRQALDVLQEALETKPLPRVAGLLCYRAVKACNEAGQTEEAQNLLASLPLDVVAWHQVCVVRYMLRENRDDQATSLLNEMIAGLDAGQPLEGPLEKCLRHYRYNGRIEVLHQLARGDGASERVREIALKVIKMDEHNDPSDEEEPGTLSV